MSVRLLFFTLLLSGGWTNAMAQTEVSGGIFADVTWTAANSPYLVTGEVVIFPGASLTVEPGTEVRVAPGLGIETREGAIYMNGTAEAPILLTVDVENPDASTKWRGIFSTTPQFTPIDLAFSYLTIEYAETGIWYNGSGQRFVDHAIFRNNDRAVYDGGQGYDWITFTNSEFYNNGIGTQGRVSCFDCVFDNNDRACVNSHSFQNATAGARFNNCTFTNNNACFILLPGFYINHAWVDGSTFENNGIVGNLYRLNAKNSTFEGSDEYAITFSTGTLEDCYFTGNEIAIKTSPGPYQDTIRNNIIVNNNIGIEVNAQGTYLKNNSICDNTTYNAYVNTAWNVDLSENCWCSVDETVINQSIFDAMDDVSSGLANYSPFTTDCLTGLLYAGDANSNGIANAWDLLTLGVHYGTTGMPRTDAHSNWQAAEAPDWGTHTIGGLDLKHADANGDGIIDETDLLAIQQNYNQTHLSASPSQPVHDNENTYSLTLIGPAEVIAEQPVTFSLELTDTSNPVDDFYGLAFALTANSEFFTAGSFSLNFIDSWLGSADELLTITREFPADNRIEVAIVRKDGQPISGNGKIADLNFVMADDLIISIETFGPAMDELLELRLENIEAVTHQGILLQIDFENTPLIISNLIEFDPEIIRLYPNPATDRLNISADNIDILALSLFNLSGVRVAEYSAVQRSLDLSNLPRGIYYLQVQTPAGVGTQKIILN